MTENQEMKLEQLIIEKAWESEEFRNLLLQDPKAAIRQAFPDVMIPEKIKIAVHEDKPDFINFVLPTKTQYAMTGY